MKLRLATAADIPALETLIPLSARKLQSTHYSEKQIEGAIGTVFGVDSQLITDGTYFVVEISGQTVGCGGWSKRRTLFGADAAKKEPDALLDPRTDAARIRAFFVHPDFARRGIGRQILVASETAAFAAGFTRIDIVATRPGELLYAAFGYAIVKRFSIRLANGETMPVAQMSKNKTTA